MIHNFLSESTCVMIKIEIDDKQYVSYIVVVSFIARGSGLPGENH
jgi:hypothetical protein